MREGYANITTRKLALEANANHGLVHYYFGSMEELFMRVLERFTDRIIQRQRAMYESPGVPFIEKWRAAMNYIDLDLANGYPKIYYELQALAWNKPEYRERIVHVFEQWDTVLTEAITIAAKEYGLDRRHFPPDAIAVLVRTFNLGLLLERLNGFDGGHDRLLKMIDKFLERLERGRKR